MRRLGAEPYRGVDAGRAVIACNHQAPRCACLSVICTTQAPVATAMPHADVPRGPRPTVHAESLNDTAVHGCCDRSAPVSAKCHAEVKGIVSGPAGSGVGVYDLLAVAVDVRDRVDDGDGVGSMFSTNDASKYTAGTVGDARWTYTARRYVALTPALIVLMGTVTWCNVGDDAGAVMAGTAPTTVVPGVPPD